MPGNFHADPDGLSRVIRSLQDASDDMGKGAHSAPQTPDAGSSTDASASALSQLMESAGEAVEAVNDLSQRLTEVRDTYVRGDAMAAAELSTTEPSAVAPEDVPAMMNTLSKKVTDEWH